MRGPTAPGPTAALTWLRAVLLWSTLAALTWPGEALAQSAAPACAATLTVAPTAGPIGTTVTITGRGFTAACPLVATTNGDGLIFQNAGAGATPGYAEVADPRRNPPINADGAFSVRFAIPATLLGNQGAKGGLVRPGRYYFHTQPPMAEAFFTVTSAAPDCRFVLGFAALHSMLLQQVGRCVENEQHNPANGDALQHTTGGLLVWRKADNWTAFTDGYHTWVAGPNDLAERLNTQRFAWEANPAGLPIVPEPPLPVGVTVTDPALGIALTVPTDWRRAAPGKEAPGVLAFSRASATPSTRLYLSSRGTTTDADEAQAASLGMDALLRGVSPAPARTAVIYDGAPGVLAWDVPSSPGPVTAIILAHQGALYKFLLPGTTVAPDQQQALNGLRFIPRVGPFPPAN